MLELLAVITNFVKSFGYFGIFIMTFIESTFVPIPGEITMIPAGYLVDKGEMEFLAVLLCAIAGTIGGSWLNYYIAARYGRNLITKYGKYFFMRETNLIEIEKFFEKHGAVSTFTGRLIPGVRHYISFPAGLAKMNLKQFFFYTALGGSIWMTILLLIGYVIGENEEQIKHSLLIVKGVLIVLLFVLVVSYIFWKRKHKPNLYK